MSDDTYGVSSEKTARTVPAPSLPYQPSIPQDNAVGIGLIGCGGI